MLGSLFRSRNTVRHAAPHAGEVSVVVPLYNHAEYIAGAIESALAQGAVLRELVVIDDGSTDGSDEAMRRLARRDARIRFRRQANRGAAATLNAAVAACSGAYVAILNSDDAWLPGRLRSRGCSRAGKSGLAVRSSL